MVISGICGVNIQHMTSRPPALHGRAPVEILLKDGATPKAVHTPALIPVHWQEVVHQDLMRDVALCVIERVPHGDAVMVSPNGSHPEIERPHGRW